MVGIISLPNNLLVLAFGQLIAVTKFATGSQILERYVRGFNSPCKGPISDGYKI